jgi:hypothetical protein
LFPIWAGHISVYKPKTENQKKCFWNVCDVTSFTGICGIY